MTVSVLIAVGTALIVSGISPMLIRPVLARLAVLDVPNERSSHSVPVLRGGGLAPLAGFLAGMFVLAGAGTPASPQLLAIGLAGTAAGVLGLIEDLRGVRIIARAGAQFVIGACATSALLVASDATLWWLPLGAILFAGYTNATNFMDGINGISGLHGGAVGSTFAVIGMLSGRPWLTGTGLVLAASFLVFLPWNLTGKRMFLGDVGSYLLGGAIGATAIAAVVDGAPLMALIAPLGIYLTDTTWTLGNRILRGEAWQQAHRTHVYQRLTDTGFSHLSVASIVTAGTLAMGCLGLASLAGSVLWSTLSVIGIMCIAVVYLSLPRILFARKKRTKAEPELDFLPTMPAASEGRNQLRWAVVGGTGFIGAALIDGLRLHGTSGVIVTAPRLRLNPRASPAEAVEQLRQNEEAISDMATALVGIDVVVNAAGLASPGALSDESLFGANALLPAAILRAAERAGLHRMIHLSSAAVQGRREVLDETAATSPFSPYSTSKALGEAVLLACIEDTRRPGSPELVIVRATSVQGAGRATTVRLRRLAQSRADSVARPGNRPTVVSSVKGLVEFIAHVGAFHGRVPRIVLQPWEGMTTSAVLEAAGGRIPRRLPMALCQATVAIGFMFGRVLPSLTGHVRRVELMWLGQAQNASWAQSVGFENASYVAEVFSDARESVH